MSKAKLEYTSGMNLGCVSSEEFEIDGDWFRAECFRDEVGLLHYECFTRIGVYWKKITSDREANCGTRVSLLRMLETMGNRLLQRARISAGELQLL